MEFNVNEKKFKPVYVSTHITSRANQLLSEAAQRSGRTKTQEAKLRLHDHLEKYLCISELNKAEEI